MVGASESEATSTQHKLRQFRSRPDLTPPLVDVVGATGRRGTGYDLITANGPMIVDDHGSPIWYRPVSHASTNLRVQQYQGRPVLTWWEGEVTQYGVGQNGIVVMVDSSYQEVMRVKAADGLHVDLHEFLISEDGIGYLTAYREITGDLSAVGGPRRATLLDAVVQGIDLASGTLVFDWHSADHIGLGETHQKYSRSSKAPFDPVHVNSIDMTEDGNLLISARNTWTIYKLDRSSGEVIWRLGGEKNDFVRGPGVDFAWQHDARGHPGGTLSLFDDEASPAEAIQSRGLVLAVDETKMTAMLVRAYTHPRHRLLAGSQGSLQVLPNGDVFVGWGAEPYYTQFHADGTPVIDAHISEGQSYRAFRFPWAGTPTGRPAVAARRDGRGRLDVYSSWNGATDVARLTVLGGGSSAAVFEEIGSSDRTGFETRIPVQEPDSVRFVAAEARGASGRVLATSPAIRV
jgi:hypothetical protein